MFRGRSRSRRLTSSPSLQTGRPAPATRRSESDRAQASHDVCLPLRSSADTAETSPPLPLFCLSCPLTVSYVMGPRCEQISMSSMPSIHTPQHAIWHLRRHVLHLDTATVRRTALSAAKLAKPLQGGTKHVDHHEHRRPYRRFG